MTTRFTAITTAFIALTVAAAQAGAPNAHHTVIPAQASYGGVSLGEWLERGWQWFDSTSTAESPNFDFSGTHYSVGQSGPVWFLPFFLPGAHLTVPAGNALFISLGATETFLAGAGATEEELRALLGQMFTARNPMLEIDDVTVSISEANLVTTDFYDIILPDGNLVGIPGGNYGSEIGQGYAVVIPPMSVGQHTIHTAWDFGSPTIHWEQHFTIEVAPAKN